MSKSANDIAQSRDLHLYLRSIFGFSPRSVLEETWSISTRRKYKTYSEQSKEIYGDKQKNSAIALSSVGARHGALSDFPHKTARDLLRFYLYENGDPRKMEEPGFFMNYLPIVLDPFAGHNSRMEDCFTLGLNYIGWDISHNFMEANRQIRAELQEENSRSMSPVKSEMMLIEADSRGINYVEVADLMITSPPFWNLENYGDEPLQLGRLDYDNFIMNLGFVFSKCYTALKEGSFAAVEVNDFRKDGKFYAFHSDTIAQLKAAGFAMHDVIVIDYGSSFFEVFLTDVEHHKIMPKVHSYMLVGKKGRPVKCKRAETRLRLIEQANNAIESGKVVKQRRLDDALVDTVVLPEVAQGNDIPDEAAAPSEHSCGI